MMLRRVLSQLTAWLGLGLGLGSGSGSGSGSGLGLGLGLGSAHPNPNPNPNQVEYWWRDEWKHVEAHADVDEALAAEG